MRRTNPADTPPAPAGPPVITAGPVVIQAECPDCGHGGPIPAELHTVLTVSDEDRRLRITVKAKTVEHTCGSSWDAAGDRADPDQLGFDGDQ